MQIFKPLYPIRYKRMYQYMVRRSGLVAYYPMNEGAGSVCKNFAPKTRGTNNGTITDATLKQSGQVGKAYSFNGTSATVDFSNGANLVAGTGSLSFGIITLIPNSTSNQFPMSSRNGGGSTAGYELFTSNSSVAGRTIVRVGDGTNSANTSDKNLTASAWHALSAVIDKTQNLLICYTDGTAVDAGTSINSIGNITNAQNLSLSKRGSNFYAGTSQHCFVMSGILTARENLKIARIAGLAS